ncbi:amidohydrolase family protein [Flavobacteriaceae bacterium S0825]|uniref:amidohydrolase family protein n=1 Tax=Gaetbulibacter sp. S0825 TaxID=2720084 RepID=UPI0014301989|nr:amidohydrolase family protein [Gaetbulibacter sp. S0825]MCK0110109.1 amidohydrolase family protein [Flavobacteriaceae bacterium S0825]NIX65738.1 amidohydrolase family protein [Gaetbulibacter sp. S0825]
MIKKYLILMMLMCSFSIVAQEHVPKNDGVKSVNTNYTAFTNAKIYVTPTQVINKGTLLIHDGKVVATGTTVNIPANAVVIDVSGKSIYPSFIDLYSSFGVEKPKRQGGGSRYDANREGFYWNDHIRPEQNAVDHFKYDSKTASALRNAGFGVVNTHLQDGIMRGTGALVALKNEGGDGERILDDKSADYLALNKSVKSSQAYPSSIMGTFALIRQVHHDADWYAKGGITVKDRSLEAFNSNKSLVKIIAAGSKINALRIDKIGDEFGTQYVILGGGDEYENIKAIKATNATFILPLNFPNAYDVEDTFAASVLELSAMREWNQRPSNPKALADNGIPFTFTTNGLKSPNMLNVSVMKAIEYGLDKTKALEALTTVPAQVLGQPNKIGSLKNGAFANFLITSGELFSKGTKIYENWVKGDRNIISDMTVKDIDGDYSFTMAGKTYDVSISGSSSKPKANVKSDEKQLGAKITYKDNWVNLTFTSLDTTQQEFMRFTSRVNQGDNLSGKLIDPNGNSVYVVAQKAPSDDATKNKMSKKSGSSKDVKIVPVTYPNGAYGVSELPRQETILFKNATVWTNESDGILKNTDVLIKDGKIAKVGSNLSDRNATVVDATGKHLTAGVIDEHTHIAATSINEGGQNSSAEVSIEDVIDPEDISIYRNLAGGVTSAQILHGSANPIGGRSAIIKLKWGESADGLLNKNAPKFIKFALGENVKQSRSQSGTRFPRTRMGVEQLFVDNFTRAKEYEAKKKSGQPYRKDIEMETLVEIMNGDRFISCHSYVQTEINMMMKVAERFGFRVNTFTHILEGYKVADIMKEHGVGASTFSDWWAYKYEVNDAIPYNASIMHNVGITTAINSDDGEMSRRLNQEAGKTVKYGGVSEEEAWKMVTLNPAKLLHIDDRVGSIKVGKDADVVLWSDHPLSVYAKAEKTLIEGATYFDIEKDKQMRLKIKQERSDLMSMMLQEKNKGMKTQPIKVKEKQLLHCDSMD